MITLYTTHCPKCIILKSKLDNKNIVYETITDVNIMLAKGFMAAPILDVDGEVMDFVKANNWINKKVGQ